MQRVRNFLFYFSPLLGAALGGVIGLGYNTFSAIVEVLIGFGAGCVFSVVMIVLSVRARFKSDVTLTQSALEKDPPRTTERGPK